MEHSNRQAQQQGRQSASTTRINLKKDVSSTEAPPVTPPVVTPTPPQPTPPRAGRSLLLIAAVVLAIAVVGFFALSTCKAGLGPTSTQITVKNAVNEYSWEELSAIAHQISEADDDLTAREIAREYNLCNGNGDLDGTQTKVVEFSDGTTSEVQIVGFRHDPKTSGSVAGITFLFTECIDKHPMNRDGSSSGGWKNSDLRDWLSSSLFSNLPDELQDAIVEVDKETNNIGETSDPGSVTITHDKLWLPSVRELCGSVDWATGKNARPGANKILNSEGEAYERYSGFEIVNDAGNDILAIRDLDHNPCDWWLRSTRSKAGGYFYFIDQTGEPRVMTGESDQNKGIVPGFCL